MIREAFFPTGAQRYAVEAAHPQDGDAICAICERHEGPRSLKCLCEWWMAAPDTFRVVRNQEGKTVGFYCLSEPSGVHEPIHGAIPLWQPGSGTSAIIHFRRTKQLFSFVGG